MKLLASNDSLILQLLQDSNYRIEKNGTVFILVTVKNSSFWRQTGTYIRGGYYTMRYKTKNVKINRVIYAKYGSLRLEKHLAVNHIDSNKLNDNMSNLELITHGENMKHAYKSGKAAVVGNFKINLEIANQIRKLKSQGYTLNMLVKEFKLAKSTISYIINNKTWKN